MPPPATIGSYSILFWDFDGVIKESVGVKGDAFERLFTPFGAEIGARVRQHHERNGGMSRFEKLPLYLEWAAQPADAREVARYGELFSAAVRRAVIDSAWVPGAREYLEANYRRQRFVAVTATPQNEIDDILRALEVTHWFREVHGAPTAKAAAIASVLARSRCRPQDALVIGDSEAEFRAATATGVDFLLRRTSLNEALQRAYSGPQCEDFAGG
jgi:phosphoglycolate phosphatase-like HAD superfamily hydrolase